MNTSIVLPSKPRIVSESEDTGVYEIDGFYPGYGHTMGNSLRRILLSSLPGAAVTRMKIDGADHEFSTIPGVKEDVVGIIINVKKLRFKTHSDEPQKVSINVKGKKEATAKDIESPSQVEVVNPDVHIATLTSDDASFKLEMTVESGLGYVTREMIEKEKAEVGMMVLDASFTPVRRANYEVENMRIGDRTDHNRVRLTIQTDTTITPREALEEAIKIAIKQLQAIVGFEEEVEEETEKETDIEDGASEDVGGAEEAEEEKSESTEDTLKVRIEDLGLSERVVNSLSSASIRTVGGLVKRSEEDLLEIEGLGNKAIQEIKRVLGRLGVELKQ